MDRLFVYGTLIDKKIESEVFRDRPTRKILDKLKGFSKISLDISLDETDYQTIIPDSNGMVDGYVLEISNFDLIESDKWESNYYRDVVKLKSGTLAFVYMMRPEIMMRALFSVLF